MYAFADLESLCVPNFVSFALDLLQPSLGCLGPTRLNFSCDPLGDAFVEKHKSSIDFQPVDVRCIIDQGDPDAQSSCSAATHESMPILGLKGSDSGGDSPEVREYFGTTDSGEDDDNFVLGTYGFRKNPASSTSGPLHPTDTFSVGSQC